MDATLKRLEEAESGIFSLLQVGGYEFSCLEHAFGKTPKIPPGMYMCKRGKHRLHGMSEDFETFEVEGVLGHSGILFHWGNYNKDSDGCILVGEVRSGDMIVNSVKSFTKFMAIQDGVSQFQLQVIGV